MCILYCRIDPTHPTLPVVLTHLRDEDPERPTAPPVLHAVPATVSDRLPPSAQVSTPTAPHLPDSLPPSVVCGVDLIAGGTWAGFNRDTGSIVALTNVRSDQFPPPPNGVSRGALVAHLLNTPVREYVAQVGYEPDATVDIELDAHYAGFNILLINAYDPAMGAYTLTNCSRDPAMLPFNGKSARLTHVHNGSIAFSNGVLGDTWLKVDWLKDTLDAALSDLPARASIQDVIAAVEAPLRTQNAIPRPRIDDVEGDIANSYVSLDEEYLLRGNVFTAPGKVTGQGTVTRHFTVLATHKWAVSYAFADTYPLPDPDASLDWDSVTWPRHKPTLNRPSIYTSVDALRAGNSLVFGQCFVTAMGASTAHDASEAEIMARSLPDRAAVASVDVSLLLHPESGTSLMVPALGPQLGAAPLPPPFDGDIAADPAAAGVELYHVPLSHYAQPMFPHAPSSDACHLDNLTLFDITASPAALCACVVIFDAAGRLLVTRRRDGPVFPRKWVVPGGRVDPGETLQQAARREVLEETGLDAELVNTAQLTPLGIWESHLFQLEKVYAIMYFALVLPNEPPLESLSFQAKEVSQALWMPPEWFSVVLADDDEHDAQAAAAAVALSAPGIAMSLPGSGEPTAEPITVSGSQLRLLIHPDTDIHEELAFGHKYALALAINALGLDVPTLDAALSTGTSAQQP